MQVPAAIEKGKSATLHCWYDLEGTALYAVKWYKERSEFYRYTPKENPSVKTFTIGMDLQVNKEESNATQVTLMNLDLNATGEYSCEVSADAPSFHTAIVYATMHVAEFPTEMPKIHGLQRKYAIGETLRLNCSSARSNPAANLTWFVNDHQPQQSYVRTYGPLDTNDSEWHISHVGLQFLVTDDHFTSGKLKIRCSASIYNIYWQSTEVSAEEDKPRVIQLEPAATIVGMNYPQPPPNLQTGQRKPDGHLDVKDIGSSSTILRGSPRFVLELLVLLRLAIR